MCTYVCLCVCIERLKSPGFVPEAYSLVAGKSHGPNCIPRSKPLGKDLETQ